MAQRNQVKNGKAFEYAIAKVYCEHINQQGINAVLVENEACVQARGYYEGFEEKERCNFDRAAIETISTMTMIEPGLMAKNTTSRVIYSIKPL